MQFNVTATTAATITLIKERLWACNLSSVHCCLRYTSMHAPRCHGNLWVSAGFSKSRNTHARVIARVEIYPRPRVTPLCILSLLSQHCTSSGARGWREKCLSTHPCILYTRVWHCTLRNLSKYVDERTSKDEQKGTPWRKCMKGICPDTRSRSWAQVLSVYHACESGFPGVFCIVDMKGRIHWLCLLWMLRLLLHTVMIDWWW